VLTRDEVIWGYRYVLGREPESASAMTVHDDLVSWQQFRDVLLGSTEFQALFGAYKNPDRWVLADLNDRRMWVNLADRAVSFPCLQGDYEPAETRAVRRLLKPGQAFVDIGANIGWFSAIAATILRDEGSIVAVEPRPDIFHWLVQTLDLAEMGTRISAHQLALGDAPGSIDLTWGRNTPNPGGSRLVRDGIPEGQEGVRVDMVTLDSLALPSCDFIKIDVEGAEMIALRGGSDTISRDRPIVMSEIHNRQLRDVSRCSAVEYARFFTDRSYDCLLLEGTNVQQDMLERDDLLNVIFVPSEKANHTKERLAA